MVNAVRLAREVARRHRRILGVGAREGRKPRHREHLLTLTDLVDARTRGNDRAREIPAENRGELMDTDARPRPSRPVDGVDPRGHDAYQDLVLCDRGDRYLDRA